MTGISTVNYSKPWILDCSEEGFRETKNKAGRGNNNK
jgi:hypothetical protein